VDFDIVAIAVGPDVAAANVVGFVLVVVGVGVVVDDDLVHLASPLVDFDLAC
jgi:hypothetical protein